MLTAFLLFFVVDGHVTPEDQRRGRQFGGKKKAEITGLDETKTALKKREEIREEGRDMTTVKKSQQQDWLWIEESFN